MRLITFEHQGQQRVGAWFDGDRDILDLADAAGRRGLDGTRFASMRRLIEGGDGALDDARDLLAWCPADSVRSTAKVRLLAPVPRPVQMRDCVAFELHMKQARRAAARMRLRNHPRAEEEFAALEASGALSVPPVWYERPIYYKANRMSVVGDGADIHCPPYADIIDYELEFGVFIGKAGRDIPQDRAREHIFGYTIFNDISARDTQASESPGMMGPAKGKDFDTGNVLGPCIVTRDEIDDPYNLQMQARVDGELWSLGNTSTMHHRFEQIIAYISRSETLYPGEFIGSGTVGNGCGYELGRFPPMGSVIELSVEKIGTLRNRLVRP